MASRTRSVKLPGDLAAAAEQRANQLGYPSWNAYIKGLIRYDTFVQGSHSITLPMAMMPPAEQDAIDAKCLSLTKLGVGERGQFLEKLLKRNKRPEV
ncbi:MAG: hypothetical protein JWO08_1168 [Verrucomicrobiaceae bacterium]|nr:hypothetical protein [Verrucomicrobiaceae bacterium]